MINRIANFKKNEVGNDYIIGDLHGCFHLFLKLLKYLNFDPEKDRMFSVGDLCDRGPESLRCLALMYESWFHSVFANHEEMFVQGVLGDSQFFMENWIANGGDWQQLVPNELLLRLSKKANELPYVINLERPDGSLIHIVHAELGPYYLTDEDLENEDRVMQLAKTPIAVASFELQSPMFWGRDVGKHFAYRPNVTEHYIHGVIKSIGKNKPYNDELSLIVSGHTIMKQPIWIKDCQLFIDTGAFLNIEDAVFGLTCVRVSDMQMFTVRESGVAIATPIIAEKYKWP